MGRARDPGTRTRRVPAPNTPAPDGSTGTGRVLAPAARRGARCRGPTCQQAVLAGIAMLESVTNRRALGTDRTTRETLWFDHE